MAVIFHRFLGRLALAMAGLLIAPQGFAGDAELKIVLENDKVQVREIAWHPGDERPAEAVGARVVKVLAGGTLARIYPDGTTQNVVFKTGDVKWFDASASAYALKNVGESDVVLFATILK